MVLRKRLHGMHGRALAGSVAKILAASAAMGVVCYFSSRGIENWMGTRKIGQIVTLAVSIPLGGLVYYAVCRVLQVAELEAAWGALAAPLARRLGLSRN
jgi:hypothetical protein